MFRLLLLTALACALTLPLARPSHAAVRYLDEVFPSVDVTSNIPYGEAIDEDDQPETLWLDLYQPAGDTLAARPVLIFIHGGGFTGGSKTNPNIVDVVTRFAKRGYVTASISYRLREGGFPPEQQLQVIVDAQHDAQAAARWFRANAGTYAIDTGGISIGGYSAGAVTSLFVAYNSGDPGDSGNPGYPSDVSAVIDVSGGTATALMDAGEPPVMIVHGTNDATVPYSSAEAIVARAQEIGLPYELHTLQGQGHNKLGPNMNDITDWSAAFLYAHVTGPGSGVGGIAGPPREGPGAASAGGRSSVSWSAGALVVIGAVSIVGAAAAGFTRRWRASRGRRGAAPLG